MKALVLAALVATTRPGDNDPSRQTQGGQQALPNSTGTNRK